MLISLFSVVQGETFFYGICQAMDGEKDPHCLMLTFPIVEALVQIYPDPSGSLDSFCEDLFTLLGCYFPIHFTHVSLCFTCWLQS